MAYTFSIIPMFGIVIAFKDYNPGVGIWKSEWIGLENFKYMFLLSDSKNIFINTVFISTMKIIGNLIVPLVFALLLNEVRISALKRGIQTIVYLPHFLSWVILSSILLDVFSYTGPVNQLLLAFGKEPILFLHEKICFLG